MNLDQSKALSLLESFTRLRDECEKLKKKMEEGRLKEGEELLEKYGKLVESLLESYHDLRRDLDVRDTTLSVIELYDVEGERKDPIVILTQIIMECSKAIGYLQTISLKDKLDSLREGIRPLERSDYFL